MLEHLKLIFPYIGRYRGYFIFGLVAICASNYLALKIPLVLRTAINGIDNGPLPGQLLESALVIIALAVGAGVFRFLVRRSIIWASRKIGYDLRGDLFAHVVRLDGPFFDRTSTGDIITRATSDIDQVRMLVGPGIMQGLNTISVAAVAIPFMFILDVELALYALAPLPFLAIATNFIGGIAHRRSLAVQESFSRLTGFVQESLAGIRVIKAYSREKDRSDRFRADSVDYFGKNMHLTKLWGAFMPLMTLLASSAIILILYFGGTAVISGRIDLGALVAFTVYLGLLVWPMIAFGWVISLYQRGAASLKRLGEVFACQPATSDPSPEERLSLARGSELAFRHLSFSFNGNGGGLSDISFVIKPGETVALAGPTGSGKSTVAQLLTRRYPVADGMMLLGGVDANRVAVRDWRAHVATVAQEPFLFSQSLGANIAFGAGDLSEDRLVEVARIAAFDKDVQGFPERYDTMVGERGLTLSGGQKQRATLARALAVDADILVLDDAFSAVDAQTEQEILAGLTGLFGSRIIILITHRIATLRRCDRVLFLEHGHLTDSGTHDAMIEHGGAYANWVSREQLREELENM